tara:strand:- start:188 stop:301 length:114 start_codon:yes stop_codon:yes gene_type:complete
LHPGVPESLLPVLETSFSVHERTFFTSSLENGEYGGL